MRWYRSAAEQGHAMAQNNLGWMYEHGRGVAKDEGEAVRWYRSAAEQGYAMAQNNLGAMYANGLGVPTDKNQAAFWFQKAAEQGIGYSVFGLAQLNDPRHLLLTYRFASVVRIQGGHRFPEDETTALLMQAAALGFKPAKDTLSAFGLSQTNE